MVELLIIVVTNTSAGGLEGLKSPWKFSGSKQSGIRFMFALNIAWDSGMAWDQCFFPFRFRLNENFFLTGFSEAEMKYSLPDGKMVKVSDIRRRKMKKLKKEAPLKEKNLSQHKGNLVFLFIWYLDDIIRARDLSLFSSSLCTSSMCAFSYHVPLLKLMVWCTVLQIMRHHQSTSNFVIVSIFWYKVYQPLWLLS